MMRESVSFMKDALRRLRRNKIAMICLFTIVLIALIAFLAPNYYPYSYTKQDVTAKYLRPFEYSAKEQAKIDKGQSVFPHIMGTDVLGRATLSGHLRYAHLVAGRFVIGCHRDCHRHRLWFNIGVLRRQDRFDYDACRGHHLLPA